MSVESHVYHQDGELAGLYTIDGVEARKVFGIKRFWEGIDEVVRLYTELHPMEMKTCQLENATTRLDNRNKYGSNDIKSMRQALNVPYGLYLVLIDYEPTLFRNKKTRTTFMKRYPVMRSCDAV